MASRSSAGRMLYVSGIFYVLACMMPLGCGDSGDQPKDTDVSPGDDTDSGSTSSGAKWSFEEVEGDDVGIDAKIAAGPNNEIGVAYFTNLPYDDGDCTELLNTPYPLRKRHVLRFARKPAGGSFSIEDIDTPLYPALPTGLGLAYTPSGEPAVAYRGGEPEINYCGANDAYYAVRSGGTWTSEVASADSGESATGDEASDAGFGMGWNPALAFDASGEPAIIHQDRHFVYLQRDDVMRADAELAWRSGGTWQHEAVDYGDGAGSVNAILFDADNRPIVFYAIPNEAHGVSRHGVWASRRNEDGTWDRVQLHTGATGSGISAALDPVHDEPVVAFYSASDLGVKVRRLVIQDAFTDIASWSSDIVRDARYDEGDDVSLAFSKSGAIALSYHRCKRVTLVGDGCDINDEALIFATEKQGKWQPEVVRQGEQKSCGTDTSLTFTEDGTAHIAFQCTKEFMGKYSVSLYVASKKL